MPQDERNTFDAQLQQMTAELVAAYVAYNPVPAADLPALIGDVHSALARLDSQVEAEVSEPQKPAVSVRKSVADDHLVCLEDGKKFKSLKRHLSAVHGMTPEQYRAKWGLPENYPMVAPNYSATRSNLAKTSGLGKRKA